MDEMVRRAMARWPAVPAVYGWLALDRRGRWRLREGTVSHAPTAAFIGRNYAPDDAGRWYFQNGPQRVFVDLDYLPLVCALDGEGGLRTHTGRAVERVERAWVDGDGALLLACEHGPALVDDRDLEPMADRLVERGGRPCDDDRLEALLERPREVDGAGLALAYRGALAPLGFLDAPDVPGALGFDPRPRDPAGGGATG